MKNKWVVFSLGFFILSSLIFSQGKEIENNISAALEELKKGNRDAVIELLSNAIMLIQNEKEFRIKEIVLCSDVQDFQSYTKKDGNTIQSNEPLLLYIEPEGFLVRKEDKKYNIWVSEDVSVVNEDGEEVFEKKDWVVYKKGFDRPMIPFYITNRITDIPPGKYVYTFTLKDHYKKTFITEDFEFHVQ